MKMRMDTAQLKIGELAKRTGLQIETIRYYEREGLLPAPARSAGNYRLYGPAHAERLQFIRHCRSLNMTLGEVEILLNVRDTPEQSCITVNDLLDKHIDDVARRVHELQALENQLKELRNRCCTTQAAKDCNILKKLSDNDN